MPKNVKSDSYRIRIADHLGNVSYIVRRASGHVDYFSSDEVPLALSNLVSSSAAELRFKLSDAKFGVDAEREVRKVLETKWRNNLPLMPAINLL